MIHLPRCPSAPAILLAGVMVCAALPCRAEPLVVTTGPIERILVETGELRAVRSRDLVAPGDWRSDPLVVWMRAEGSTVAEGDTLVRFDTTAILQQVTQAEATLQRRQSEFEARRAAQRQEANAALSRLRGAEFAAEQSRLRLDRMEFAAEVERQSARLELKRTELLLEEARTKAKAQTVLDSLELAQLRTGIDQARADLARERAQVDRMVIVAPIAGLVIHGESGEDERKIREGDAISPGTIVVRLPDLSELEVVASVHELDRALLAEGQSVRVGFDAYPDLRLEGRVRRVAELAGPARRRSRIQRFEVRIEVDGTDPRLRPGMTARLEVVIDRREDCVRVPRAALAMREGRPVVVTRDGRVVEVSVGLRTPFWVELIDGPPAGTELREAASTGLESFAASESSIEEEGR